MKPANKKVTLAYPGMRLKGTLFQRVASLPLRLRVARTGLRREADIRFVLKIHDDLAFLCKR